MKWRRSFTFVILGVMTLTYADPADANNEYLECTHETDFNPGVCNCTKQVCLIKFDIKENKTDTGDEDEDQLFTINGGRMGPTIIVEYNQIVVVDVYNNIDDTQYPNNSDTSIHWHGMHQWSTGWMDGVGMVTQWPLKPNNTFRHVFRAIPAGTHWYHSHMRYQRDQGIVGVLIVKDKETAKSKNILNGVIDKPHKHMLAIRDQTNRTNNKSNGQESSPDHHAKYCMPDGSTDPSSAIGENRTIEPFRINGVKLSQKVGTLNESLEPIFYVKRGEKHRFRIVGIMSEYMVRFSIDKHNLIVIATDGYLVKEFSTDILMIHVGERYDFILRANAAYDAGTVFPIRIETLEVLCDNPHNPSKVGIAYLQYTDGEDGTTSKNKQVKRDDKRCNEERKCVALNCPFEKYAPKHYTKCYNVRELQLVNPTPDDQLPENATVIERFFNFGFYERPNNVSVPTVNSIQNKLPEDMPFTNNVSEPVQNECIYENIKHNSDCDKACPHAVFLNNETNATEERFKPQVVRFVLSSLGGKKFEKLSTHPIHLHGHSFFVAKIAYPEYFTQNETIQRPNPNITLPECGHGNWTNGMPSGITVNESTVRKDVIAIPAGGYVVIEFLADNPGWWFLHCHIDEHLNGGMAIAVTELPNCQTKSGNKTYTVSDNFSDSERNFKDHEKTDDICFIRHKRTNDDGKEAIYADEAENQADNQEIEKKSDEINLQNVREKSINAAFNKDRDYDLASAYYERLFRRHGAHANPVQRKFQDRRRDELAELDAFNEQIEESIQHGGNEEYM